MARVFSGKNIVAIDIGTTKICVLIAQPLGNETLEILGIGKAPSEGLRKGVVVDVARTIRSIKAAVKEAEVMAGITVESAYIGISGGHISSLNAHGAVPIKMGEVRPTDVANVLEAAQAIPVPEGQRILHVLPQYFTIDGGDRLHDPVGMHGVRLEVMVHIILGSISSVQNLVKCCEDAGVKVDDIVLEQLASADAVLSRDELELGVAVLDIGGGTSDLAVYQQGSIRHTMVLPIAGSHVTNDIAVCLRVAVDEAERIKKEYGVAAEMFLHHEQGDELQEVIFEVTLVHGKTKQLVTQQELVQVIEPRIHELLSLVHQEIIKRHLQNFIRSGLVITGGGALLPKIADLAEMIFDFPVRIGRPNKTYELPEILENPIYATGYGLLIYALKKRQQNAVLEREEGPLAKRVMARMKLWVADFF